MSRSAGDGWRELVTELNTGPSWLPFHLDFAADSIQLVHVDAQAYHRSLFLDARLQAPGAQQVTVRLSRLVEALGTRSAAPLRWIFHGGQGGSTLLSRLLDAAYQTLPLREPLPLRSLAAAWRELDSPCAVASREQIDAVSCVLRHLTSRRFSADEVAVVKASSDVTAMAPELMAGVADDRAVVLVSRLETYLTQMLRDVTRRHEAARFAQSRLRDLQRLDTFAHLRLYNMVDCERIAMCWLSAAIALLGVEQFAADQALLIRSEDLRQSPSTIARRCARHMGLEPRGGDLDATFERVLRENVKQPGQMHDPQAWAAQLRQARQQYAEEIGRGVRFVEKLLDSAILRTNLNETLRGLL